jgi:polynucleotide 5'-kinase involved in rRNA processing
MPIRKRTQSQIDAEKKHEGTLKRKEKRREYTKRNLEGTGTIRFDSVLIERLKAFGFDNYNERLKALCDVGDLVLAGEYDRALERLKA